MPKPVLEHINITVSDIDRTAHMLSDIFGWTIRWRGDSRSEGESIHVGDAERYLALYNQGTPDKHIAGDNYDRVNGLNHIGILVDDLDAIERRVRAAGFEPYSHQTYEPGSRFYFYDHDNIEFEVVSYTPRQVPGPTTLGRMLSHMARNGAAYK